jgi:REP element-mobilizing transposase RayT
MSRPLRVDVAGGWYHVTARGIERRTIFQDDREHEHFLELLEAMVARYGIVLHAYVLMGNHYHLIVESPEANVSRAIQWLNVSYVAWFNRRHDRVGPLMQGRFKSILVENSAWAYELSVYVHLNPVMRKAMGLGKHEKRVEAQGLTVPSVEEATQRLNALHAHRWSSFGAYRGVVERPAWLCTEELLGRASSDPQQRVVQYRADVENRLTAGVVPGGNGAEAGSFAVGSAEFVERARTLAKTGREVVESAGFRKRVSWADLVRCVEEVTSEPLAAAVKRRGSVCRGLLLWAARRYGRMTLREIGEATGGVDYTAVSMAIKRFEDRAKQDPSVQVLMDSVGAKCAK